jgi:hypothetical protein
VKCPDYQIDNQEVTKEEFEEKLQEEVLSHTLERSAWTKIQ